PLHRVDGALGEDEEVARPRLRRAAHLTLLLPALAGEGFSQPLSRALPRISRLHVRLLSKLRRRQASVSFRSVAKSPGRRSRGIAKRSAIRRCEGSLSFSSLFAPAPWTA